MHISTFPDLSQILQRITEVNALTRQQGIQDLRNYAAERGLPVGPGQPDDWEEEVGRYVLNLIQSNDSEKKMLAVQVIDVMLDATREDPFDKRARLFRLYNSLTILLRDSVDTNILLVASKSLGNLTAISSAVLGDHFVEEQIPNFLELTFADATFPYGAVLSLKELAEHNPTAFFPHIASTFRSVSILLRNPLIDIRRASIQLLGAILAAMGPQEFETHSAALNNLQLRVHQGLEGKSSAAVLHGSLLATRQLFIHTGNFMNDYFTDTCERARRFQTHPSNFVCEAVFELIPTLAAHNIESFCEQQQYLGQFVLFLLSRLDGTDAAMAYLTIGHLSSAVGSKLNEFKDSIFAHVRKSLQSHHRHIQHPDYIFQTVDLLAISIGPDIAKEVNDMLDLVFDCNLSEALVQMLKSIVQHIPILLKPIQERLLEFLSLILSGRHYTPLGSSEQYIHIDKVPSVSQYSSSAMSLALKVLGDFNFDGHALSELVLTAVLPHLENESSSPRKAAALTIFRLLARDPIISQDSHHAVSVISAILYKLLSVGIVDPDPDIRKTILVSLDARLDPYLACAEYIRLLLIALHDEAVENRILAVKVIGRLSVNNPAQAIPPLRKTLVRLLAELRYGLTHRSKEDAIRILAALIASTHVVVQHHVPDILEVLLCCASENNPTVTTSVLHCIGELSAAGSENVARQVPRIMSIVFMVLESETRSTRLTAALTCLGQLCTNCAHVIAPIEEYPQLMPLLHRLLKREKSVSIRHQVIRVIGLLGAIDPNRMQVIHMEYPPTEIIVLSFSETSSDAPGSAVQDPYQAMVLDLLVDILQKPSFSNNRHLAIDSLMSIAKTRQMEFAKFVPKMMPTFCAVIRNSASNLQSYYLEQLNVLVGVIKQHVRVCITDVMDLVYDVWEASSHRLALAALVETLANVLASDFSPYVPQLLPRLLNVLQDPRVDILHPTQAKVLKALVSLGSNLQEYLNLVVPAIIATYEYSHFPRPLRRHAIESLTHLSHLLDLYPYTSRIVHSLVNILVLPDEEWRKVAADALYTIAHRLESSFPLFVPMMVKAIESNNVDAPDLLRISARLLRGEVLSLLDPPPRLTDSVPAGAKFYPNEPLLKQTWNISSLQEDQALLLDWFTHLVAQLVKESTSLSLRSCINLLDAYPHMSAHLFNPAFASCWGELSEVNKKDLVRSVERVIASPHVPAEVAYSLLDLVEYMERNSMRLPISDSSLAEYCFKHRAYAKALHYQELHFFQDPSLNTIKPLIDINAMLRQEDAALGTLNLARQNYTVENSESWYEKLGQWPEALALYEAKLEHDPVNSESCMGRLRCLHALNEWERLAALASMEWPKCDSTVRVQIALLGAGATWHIGDWDSLDQYCSMMRSDSADRAFYRAVSSIHRNILPRATSSIMDARNRLDPEMTALLDESPDRLHQFAIRAQMLSELEEIVGYKELADRPERQRTLRETWKKRLLGCQRDCDVWQRILKVRSLAMRPEDDIETVVRFANLCRKSGRLPAAQRAMQSLVRPGYHGDQAPPAVVYAQLKMLWAGGDRDLAFTSLHIFTQEIARDAEARKVMSSMLARCHLKYGNWRSELDGGINATNANTILMSHHQATKYDPQWSKAWHTWALSNLEIVRKSSGKSNGYLEPYLVPSRTGHIVAAIEGFFHSINLMNRDRLQDTLRLLTLWFKFGAQSEVALAMTNGFKFVACETWLPVVPQIIARIHTPNPVIRESLMKLLIDIGKEHPQALVYPLTVGAKSQNKPRKAAALHILEQIRLHSSKLVEQAQLVGRELTKIATTWAERWHIALQTSARHYFNGEPAAFLAELRPLYDELDRGPTTGNEKEFYDTLGSLLRESRELCKLHIAKNDRKAFDKAWEINLGIWHHLNAHLPDVMSSMRHTKTKSLDLQQVSPQLLRAVNLELAVPGTYTSRHSVVKISSFKRQLPVFDTKQRPRRLGIVGDDGREYIFLLKSREDLRQDERVMQVFGLMNQLLSRNRESLNRRLHLQRYPVIPLAPDVGLIGIMDGTDTLHQLISEYRNANSIVIDLEYRMMLEDEPDYETTTLARKVKVFEAAMERTTGQDLYRILWLKSDSSEAWVSRRLTYTRSLAVGSMIGYLLGVGDRHPANIMMRRKTGKIIHIDFGDCFEVAIERDKLPEKVPFRLTRMLRHAMEVCGIQGGFKTACEISMMVLRENKESLLAVLEALVYDPLINWRLVKDGDPPAVNAEVASSLGSKDAGPVRRKVLNEDEILDDTDLLGTNREVRNERALRVYNRVEDKLTGRDFGPRSVLSIPEQVEKLLQEATKTENLCEHFRGWSPFW